MTKVAILKRKIIHAYNNPKNWEYSKFKGYEGYFGYSSLKDLLKFKVQDFKEYYGPTLKSGVI